MNSVSPGFIDTEMTAVLTNEQKNFITNKIPLARIGKPEDVAYCEFWCPIRQITLLVKLFTLMEDWQCYNIIDLKNIY